jgi:hypothetical protein
MMLLLLCSTRVRKLARSRLRKNEMPFEIPVNSFTLAGQGRRVYAACLAVNASAEPVAQFGSPNEDGRQISPAAFRHHSARCLGHCKSAFLVGE